MWALGGGLGWGEVLRKFQNKLRRWNLKRSLNGVKLKQKFSMTITFLAWATGQMVVTFPKLWMGGWREPDASQSAR